MTTDTILAAAKAAYRVFFDKRISRQWHSEPAPVQLRWIRVSALVLNGNIKKAPDLRYRYFEGYVGVRPWEDVGRNEKERWDRALAAITWAAETAGRAVA